MLDVLNQIEDFLMHYRPIINVVFLGGILLSFKWYQMAKPRKKVKYKIKFPFKPCKSIRERFKKAGYRWIPKQQIWVAYNSKETKKLAKGFRLYLINKPIRNWMTTLFGESIGMFFTLRKLQKV